MKWYRVNRWAVEIEPVEVVSETAQFVTIKADSYGKDYTRRVAKAGEYFPSFADARDFLLRHFSLKRDGHKEEGERAHAQWLKVSEMEEPK